MHTICTWRCWTLFHLQFVPKTAQIVYKKISKTTSKNHLGFSIHVSAIKLRYCNSNVKVDSLTFISYQENYQTAEIYFYSYHVIPLYKTISN